MNSRDYYLGDSGLRKQVASCLKKAGMELRRLTRLRENVYIIKTNKNKYLLKGFGSTKKLKSQVLLTTQLKANRFSKTYDFIQNLESFWYNDYLFAWIEFLPGNKRKFTFSSRTSRQEGLLLLENFHGSTRTFYKSIPIKKFDQLEKWHERFDEFKQNTEIVKKYVSKDVIQTWLKWGKMSLKGLEKYEADLYDESPCIVHGDVAHHNFFYKDDGSLYLIDFDLISIASPLIDYLQYSNRIMPDISGSSELWDYKQLRKYKDNPAFLYALLFPTDIFREWNRLVRENAFHNNSYLHSVWKLTVEELSKRVRMYKEISNAL